MTPSSSSVNAPSKPLPMPWELLLYLLHFAVRVLVKILASLAAVAGIFIASLLASIGFLLLLYLGLDAFSDKPLEALAGLVGLPIFGLVTGLGLLNALVKIANRSALNSLRDIGKRVLELGRGWLPPLDLRRSLDETRSKYLPQIISILTDLWTLSLKFFFALALLFLLMVCFYAQAIVDRDSKTQVQNVLESVKELQARPAVVVVAGEGRAADDLPAFTTPFHTGGVYSIAHVKQGSLENGNGICLDDHVSLPWLKTFKMALEECAAKMSGCRPMVTVRGFASNAPVGVSETTDGDAGGGFSQADLNCEIANRRAEEVVNFLIDDDYECHAGEHKLERYGPRDPCKRNEKSYKFGKDKGLAFDVSYTPWCPPEEMVKRKPADDGEEGERRHKVEFFNRAVQLTLSNYGCDRKKQCEVALSQEYTCEGGATSSGDDTKDEADGINNGTPDERAETE